MIARASGYFVRMGWQPAAGFKREKSWLFMWVEVRDRLARTEDLQAQGRLSTHEARSQLVWAELLSSHIEINDGKKQL